MFGRTNGAESGRVSGSIREAEVGASSFTIAASIAGRTLKFLSCFLRSDLAGLEASLEEVNMQNHQTWLDCKHA